MYIVVVEIARGKFMKAEGESERPDGIEYLSVHCNILLLSSVHSQRHCRFLCVDFSKLSTQTRIPCGIVGRTPRIEVDDINDMPFITLLSAQIAHHSRLVNGISLMSSEVTWICLSLHMDVIAGRKPPKVS